VNDMRSRLLPLLGLPATILFACGDGAKPAPDAGPPAAVVELRADTNRNGTIDWDDPTEALEKDTWSAKHGAVFIANLDDDQKACPIKDANGALLSDIELAKCNDAADTAINGDDDLLDMARLATRPWPAAPDSATGTLSVSSPAGLVHLFKNTPDGWTYFDPDADALSAAELRAGVELAIEATDIVRDPAVWDGLVHVKLTVGDKTDSVVLKVAPVITRHHLAHENRVYVTSFAGDPASTQFRSTLKDGIASAMTTVPTGFVQEISADQRFGSAAPFEDQWTQDFFEVAYMSMPGPGGAPHVVDVYYRSANVYSPKNANNPLRPAGKVVFLKFRGPDAAAIQQFDAAHSQDMDSLNSFGNTETIPPFTLGDKSYPLGRLLRGSTSTFFPDPSFEKMLEAQGAQPVVKIDTSWLMVGHVDETVSFVKAPTQRGWVMLANDARLAKKMLEDQVAAGNGATPMFTGMKWDGGADAQTTISGVLADMAVMSASASAAAHVDAQLAILKAETGLTDDEIIHIPFLHQEDMGLSMAYMPGTVNGLSFADDAFAAPDPHGPIVDGKDIFKTQMEDALKKVGVKVVWVEDWDLYHALTGEVHCGSNSRRDVPADEKWWTY